MNNSNDHTTSPVAGLVSKDTAPEPFPVEETRLEQFSDDEIRRAALRKLAEIKRKQMLRSEDAIRRAFLRKLAEIKRKQDRRRASELSREHPASET